MLLPKYHRWEAFFRHKYSLDHESYIQPLKFWSTGFIEQAKLKAQVVFDDKYKGHDAHGRSYRDYQLWAITRLDILSYFRGFGHGKSRRKVRKNSGKSREIVSSTV
jgi:hypothetical protein